MVLVTNQLLTALNYKNGRCIMQFLCPCRVQVLVNMQRFRDG